MLLRKLKMFATVVAAVAGAFTTYVQAGTDFYKQVNLVSNSGTGGTTKDANLVNPWGVAFFPGGPFWVANNATNTATVYDGSGNNQNINVTLPATGKGDNNPTGQIYNGAGGFGGNVFIFDGEGGAISGWAGGSMATNLVDNSNKNAVYKGLTTGAIGGNNVLYATDFHNGTIDVIGSDLKPVTPSGGFTDPNLPSGYAPFNIENINGKLYVTYALQDSAKHDDLSGAHRGFVDVFNTDGVMQGRLISQGALNSPWGLALAPANFGKFSNDLLVGNFGDGTINAFNPNTGAFLGTLSDKNGKPIVIGDLWTIVFGNGGAGGQTDQLFFTAGVKDEAQGLFGHLDAATGGGQAVPLPNMLFVLPFAMLIAGVSMKRMRAAGTLERAAEARRCC
jgi:uncharacterized protein (TIGR03118 family)